MNHNLSNCETARKKVLRGFNGIRTRVLCVRAAVLYQLSHEDPYTEADQFFFFFPAISQLLKLRFTALVTYSFQLYSRSLHNFILRTSLYFFSFFRILYLAFLLVLVLFFEYMVRHVYLPVLVGDVLLSSCALVRSSEKKIKRLWTD